MENRPDLGFSGRGKAENSGSERQSNDGKALAKLGTAIRMGEGQNRASWRSAVFSENTVFALSPLYILSPGRSMALGRVWFQKKIMNSKSNAREMLNIIIEMIM